MLRRGVLVSALFTNAVLNCFLYETHVISKIGIINTLSYSLPDLEYCSAVWCSAADTHLKLLDRAVGGVRFLTEGVFECDIDHCRSVAILCILYKIRCNPMHPLNGALPGPYVPARVTRGSGRTSVYLCAASMQNLAVSHDFYFPLNVPLERSCCPRIQCVGLAGFKSKANACLLALFIFYYYYYY